MEDGTIVDTDKAQTHWDEDTYWNGHNHISKATGSQWAHETLYKSRKGRYYTEHLSAYHQGQGHVEWLSPQEAARWLLHMEYELPDDLKQYADEIEE
jgi:hypothetical protein